MNPGAAYFISKHNFKQNARNPTISAIHHSLSESRFRPQRRTIPGQPVCDAAP